MNNAIVRDATPRLLDGAGRNGSSAGHEALTFRSEALRASTRRSWSHWSECRPGWST